MPAWKHQVVTGYGLLRRWTAAVRGDHIDGPERPPVSDEFAYERGDLLHFDEGAVMTVGDSITRG
jgi:hypothetical protein